MQRGDGKNYLLHLMNPEIFYGIFVLQENRDFVDLSYTLLLAHANEAPGSIRRSRGCQKLFRQGNTDWTCSNDGNFNHMVLFPIIQGQLYTRKDLKKKVK